MPLPLTVPGRWTGNFDGQRERWGEHDGRAMALTYKGEPVNLNIPTAGSYLENGKQLVMVIEADYKRGVLVEDAMADTENPQVAPFIISLIDIVEAKWRPVSRAA